MVEEWEYPAHFAEREAEVFEAIERTPFLFEENGLLVI